MKQQDLLFIIVFTFIVIVAWAGFSIYHVAKTSTLSKEQTQVIQPITPTFDTQTLTELKKRTVIIPILNAQVIGPSPSPSATQSAGITNPAPAPSLQLQPQNTILPPAIQPTTVQLPYPTP